MKIFVFSDSHNNTLLMCDILKREKGNYDHIIHLGDHCTDIRYIETITGITPMIAVIGNCDSYYAKYEYSEEKIVELYGKRFFICHGHKYTVKQTYDLLVQRATKEDCDIALFGHTHNAVIEKIENLYLFNPGTIGVPTTNGNTYGIITIENGTLDFEIKRV